MLIEEGQDPSAICSDDVNCLRPRLQGSMTKDHPMRYVLQPEDSQYVAEFLETPVGYHSPGLQRVLNVMRGGPLEGKYVLVVLEPYQRWGLGRLPGRRGAPVALVEGVEYTCRLEAERDVFRRRWKDLTGEDIPPAPSGECRDA